MAEGSQGQEKFLFSLEGADLPSVLDPRTKPGLPTLRSVAGSEPRALEDSY